MRAINKILFKYKKSIFGNKSIRRSWLNLKRISYLLVMVIFSSIPIYYTIFWEPEGTTSSISSVSVESVDIAIKDISFEQTEKKLVINEETNKKPILRMKKEQIEEDMSDENKKKLKNILVQLSIVDLNKIEEISKQDDTDKATKEFINLLRKRLSLKEYKKIEEILIPYINFDVIY